MLILMFVTAVMGALAHSFWAAQLDVAGILLLAFPIFSAFLGHAMLIFCKLGREQVLALGLMVAQRNLGLMPAAMASVLPSATWRYFALRSLQPIARKDNLGANHATDEGR